PVGFKNGTNGTVQIAIDGIRSAAHPHHFLAVTKQGLAAIAATRGNPACHVILRGGNTGPNYDADSVRAVAAQLSAAGLPERIMIDLSHANSDKDHARQPAVAEAVARQLEGGSPCVLGVMMESFLEDGRQDHERSEQLVYGQSITDACMSWETTAAVLRKSRERLAEVLPGRRAP
ncbi:MAG: 3-deoxy-7-phosphoheptulonate synthase, partial [Myxococcales bacterium]|nr:3-deoxy-7-phosphoheptulonate synthase [Myxococcales bacterium]